MSATFSEDKKWALESYEEWDHDRPTWKAVNIDKQSCYLKLVHPLLLIEDKGVTVLSVDLSGGAGEIEVRYANANFGIKTTSKHGKTSKIRIVLANGNGEKTGSDYCSEIVDEVKKFVPVIQHSSHIEKESKGIVTQELNSNLLEIVKMMLSQNPNTNGFESIIPESDLKDIIDAFLNHPQFSTRVVEIWEQLGLRLSNTK